MLRLRGLNLVDLGAQLFPPQAPLNQGALRGAQRGLGSDSCFRRLPRVGCQQEDLRARRDPCLSLGLGLFAS